MMQCYKTHVLNNQSLSPQLGWKIEKKEVDSSTFYLKH